MRKKIGNMFDMPSFDMSMPTMFEENRPRQPPRPYPNPRPRIVYVQRPRPVYVQRGYAPRRPKVRYVRRVRQQPMFTPQDRARMMQTARTGVKYAGQGARMAGQGIKTGISFLKGKLPSKTYGNQSGKKYPWQEKKEE